MAILIPKNPYSLDPSTPFKDYRKEALKSCMQFKGSIVKNLATGNDIVVSKPGIEHSISSSKRDQKLRALWMIREALEAAAWTSSVPDKDNRPDIKHVDLFNVDFVDEADGAALLGLIFVFAYSGPKGQVEPAYRGLYELSFAKI